LKIVHGAEKRMRIIPKKKKGGKRRRERGLEVKGTVGPLFSESDEGYTEESADTGSR